MAEATLHIGGHGLHLCGGDTVEQAMRIPGMSTFSVASCPSEMEVRFGPKITLPDCRWLHEFDIIDGQQRMTTFLLLCSLLEKQTGKNILLKNYYRYI